MLYKQLTNKTKVGTHLCFCGYRSQWDSNRKQLQVDTGNHKIMFKTIWRMRETFRFVNDKWLNTETLLTSKAPYDLTYDIPPGPCSVYFDVWYTTRPIQCIFWRMVHHQVFAVYILTYGTPPGPYSAYFDVWYTTRAIQCIFWRMVHHQVHTIYILTYGTPPGPYSVYFDVWYTTRSLQCIFWRMAHHQGHTVHIWTHGTQSGPYCVHFDYGTPIRSK